MKWSRIEPYNYIITSVASEYRRKYQIVEMDDIKQELYGWFISHPRKLTEWEEIGLKDAKNLLYRSLRNCALDYCQKWKAKSLGYETADLFYYDPIMIEAMLPNVIRGDLTIMPVLNLGTTGRPPAPSEGGNLMTMMVEVSGAYHKLPMEDKNILFHRYIDGMDYPAIAVAMSLSSDDTASLRHKKAIKRLIIKLGGFRTFLDEESPESNTESENKSEEGYHDTYNHG